MIIMDNLYWEKRSNGLWLKNDDREHFVKQEQNLNESEFNQFIDTHKFVFPETYIHFLKKYNGLEVDKKITYTNSFGTKVTTIVPLILPFHQAIPYFERLQDYKKAKLNYFPIALTPSQFHAFLLKVKGIHKGRIYEFDGIMNEIPMAFDSIEDFLNILNISI